MAFRIGFFSDTHIDYSAGRRWDADGVNVRARDGHRALADTVSGMIDADVDVVIHGGDLFHGSIPTVRGIVAVREQFLRLHTAGIPVIGITGNHDYPNTRLRLPATAAVSDPERGIDIRIDPYAVFRPADGIVVHAVGHSGLLGTPVEPALAGGDVNILVSHGAADIEGHAIFHCVDSPAEAVIPRTTLQQDYAITLLGHFHGQGALPALAGTGNRAWYAGSALRRGFSDSPGNRGWLLVDVAPDGDVTVTPQAISQRPQFDLPVIDATGLSGGDITERILANLADIDLDAEPILRQRVTECPLPSRRGVDTKTLNTATEKALSWALDFQKPATITVEGDDGEPAAGLRSTGVSLPQAWAEFVASDGSLTAEQRDIIEKQGRALLEGAN